MPSRDLTIETPEERPVRGVPGQTEVAACPLHTPDDRFIPVRAGDLAEGVLRDAEFFGANPEQRRGVFDALNEIVTREATTFEASLADQYAWFNPDRDTVAQGEAGQLGSARAGDEMVRRLEHLLAKANFERLDAGQVQAAIRAANSQGLKVRVDPDKLVDFQLWVRGRDREPRRFRSVRAPIRGRWRQMTLYRRMVLVARLREEGQIVVKMFREIPLADVEALLPHASVRMSWLDRVQAFGGAGGALGSTALKLGKVAAAVAYWSTLMYVLMGGMVVLAFRAFFGYRRAKAKRDYQRTRHLYFRFMAGNAAAIHSLVAMVMQEEHKEAVLAYAACDAARLGGEPVRARDDVRAHVERYLRERYGVEIDFDVTDAIETMDRLGILDENGFPGVKAPVEAERHLRSLLRRRDHWGYHDGLVTQPE